VPAPDRWPPRLRWGAEGAEAVLRLRAVTGNGDFEAYWAFHIRREHDRLHQARCQDDYDLIARPNGSLQKSYTQSRLDHGLVGWRSSLAWQRADQVAGHRLGWINPYLYTLGPFGQRTGNAKRVIPAGGEGSTARREQALQDLSFGG
jgi:hypothetical protein